MKHLLSLVVICSLAFPTLAQEDVTNDIIQDNPNNLESQFNDVIEGSNNYQEYKVIKKNEINRLRSNVMDSVAALEKTIETADGEIAEQSATISSLENNLSTVKKDLETSKEKEDGIELLGILTQKSTYNIIMWSIIGILLVALVLFIYKYKNSHAVTRDARTKLAETEAEFEEHRRKKLEEVQKVTRKLQDEINKNRKVQ